MVDDFCVISSNCISGYWYRDVVKKQYEVPFIWCNIKLNDFIYLIKNFDTIDFNNVKTVISNGELVASNGKEHVKVVINNKISVYFIHYKQSKENISNPIVKDVDVVCPDVVKYTDELWKERSKRIPYNKIRVWVFWDDTVCTDTDLVEFFKVAEEKPNEIFVLITEKKNIKPKTKNLLVLKKKTYKVLPHMKDLENALNNYKN